MKKRIVNILLVTLILVACVSNIALAADATKTQLNVVKQASETVYLENDQGSISKTIVNSNPETGEATIELKLANTTKDATEENATEIFLVVDNSGSMGYTTSTGEVRRDVLIRAMTSLVNSIYDNSSDVKVGLVRFANSGTLLTNSTALMCDLTENKQSVLDAIEEYKNLDTSVTINDVVYEHCESGTNIERGLKRANDNFSSTCKNKILILLTDGIPNASISYSNSTSVYTATKDRLKSIGDSGVMVISMMTGVTETDENETTNAQEVLEQIFGTEEEPTTGKFYNIADANLETVVTTDILADVMEQIQNPINTVKIVDYFPEDIMENFEFSYVGEPSLGTVSDAIDTATNTITWEFDTLKGGQVATLQYKLKLKDMQNEELLNKIISTNDKVVLTYADTNAKKYTVTLSSSPKIQLAEVKEVETPTTDGTTAPGTIPQTGETYAIIITIIAIAVIGLIFVVKYTKNKDIK